MNRIECGLQAIFGGVPWTQGWLEVIAALAEAQAETGLIPAEVVPEIRRVCRIELLDMAGHPPRLPGKRALHYGPHSRAEAALLVRGRGMALLRSDSSRYY